MSDKLATLTEAVKAREHVGNIDGMLRYLEDFERRVRDAEARRAADDVESLPYRDHGRTVNRNDAIMAARRGLPR